MSGLGSIMIVLRLLTLVSCRSASFISISNARSETDIPGCRHIENVEGMQPMFLALRSRPALLTLQLTMHEMRRLRR